MTARSTMLWPVRLLLVAVSFVFYASMVVSLHQDKTVAFPNEEIGPLPAAVSNWAYGTPGGLIEGDIWHYFFHAAQQQTTVNDAVEDALRLAKTPTELSLVAVDGQGVGDIIAAKLGFALFGPHASALASFYLVLIGLSTICFAMRYRDLRMAAAPILLLSLSLLLCSPVLTGGEANEAPIGGIRYYAVVGLLPALHWCLEFGDEGFRDHISKAFRWGLLIVQLAILGLAILVRGSPLYLLLPVAATGLLTARRTRGRRRWITAGYLLVPAAVLAASLAVIPRIEFPAYAESGRLYVELWHKLFIGFGESKEWPFSGVREAFPCPEIPQGITPGVYDRSGQCAWSAERQQNPEWAAQPFIDMLYSGDYEDAVRDAAFQVFREHPWETIATFVYYKPLSIARAVAVALPWPTAPSSRPLVQPLLLQLALLMVFIAALPAGSSLKEGRASIVILVMFLVSVQLPLLAAWANAHTILDLLTLLQCGSIVAFWIFCSRTLDFAEGRLRLLFGRNLRGKAVQASEKSAIAD